MDGEGVGHVAKDDERWRGICDEEYTNPLNGVGIPFPLSLSPYDIGGYAYINPLAGLIPHI